MPTSSTAYTASFVAAALIAACSIVSVSGQTAGGTAGRSAVTGGVPAAKEFPPVPADPVERPDFQNTAHPITKSVVTATAMMIREQRDGSMIGMTSDVIATVPPETRNGKVSTAVFVPKQGAIGDEMKTSFDEAVRAVK